MNKIDFIFRIVMPLFSRNHQGCFFNLKFIFLSFCLTKKKQKVKAHLISEYFSRGFATHRVISSRPASELPDGYPAIHFEKLFLTQIGRLNT